MASRRRRPTATNETHTHQATELTLPPGAWDDFSFKAPEPAQESHTHEATELTLPPGAWDDFSAEAPELTHEEMLEIAEERKAEAQVEETPEEEETAIEVFMAMAAADTFEALMKAEEESGVKDFFEPTPPAPTPILPRAQVVPAKKKPVSNHNIQRVITRSRKS